MPITTCEAIFSRMRGTTLMKVGCTSYSVPGRSSTSSPICGITSATSGRYIDIERSIRCATGRCDTARCTPWFSSGNASR